MKSLIKSMPKYPIQSTKTIWMAWQEREREFCLGLPHEGDVKQWWIVKRSFLKVQRRK